MAGTNAVFNGNSLQTASIITDDIDHSSPTKLVNLLALAHANRSAIPFSNYPSRTVKLTGRIVGSSIADCDAKVDTFKGYLRGTDQNLDVDYNGGTRRYIATASVPTITRPGGLSYANFEVDFVCSNPFGLDNAPTTALSASGRTLASYNDNYTFLGTADYQLPIATITLAALATSSTNLCTNPDFETNTTGWATQGYGGSFSRVTSQFHGGAASMQIVNAGTATFGFYGGVQYAMSGLTVGQQYLMQFWLKGNAGGESVSYGTNGGLQTTVALTTSWTQYTVIFTAGATTAYLYITGLVASQTYYLDDVSITANVAGSLQWGNGGNGQAIVITRIWSAADVVVIDCTKSTVTINGSPAPFSGAFPEFPPGAQIMAYSDNFVSRTFGIGVVYTKAYL